MKNTFFGRIWDDILILVVKLKLCLIFRGFQNGRHFEVITNFLPEAIPEYTSKMAKVISDVLSF